MQGLTILLILTTLSSPLAADSYAYVGSLPAVEVIATRCADEDIAWSGLMPAVEVTALRYENEDIAWCGLLPAMDVTANRQAHNRTKDTEPTHTQAILVSHVTEPDGELDLSIADLKIFGAIPAAVTFSGDYSLAENDTIYEDVTVTGGNAKIDGVISGDLAVMGGRVDINGMVDGDVAVFGGNLDLMGIIDGDAAVLGGNIRNRGTIEGDLHVVGGTVYLDSASVVEGNISMVGGTVDRDTNAVVLGTIESIEIKALEKVLPRISKAFRFPRMLPGAAFPRAVFIGMLVVLYLFNVLVLLIFPNAVERVKAKIEQSIWSSVGLGIVMELLFVPLIVLLAVSIIGIPLIILLPLAVFVAILFGVSALSLTTGDRACKGFNWKVESQLGRFSLGWLALMLIPIVLILVGPPVFILGFVIIYVVMTIGLGGVIYTLIKRKAVEVKIKK